MEAASPPKRMTRARAAAKEKDTTAPTAATASTNTKSTTKAATKSAKAAPATAAKPTTTTTRTAKRKTRADEDEDEDNAQTDGEQRGAMNKPARTRGRPKKVAESKPEPELEPQPEPEPLAVDASTSTTTTKPRATRGRAKKTTTTTTPAPPKEEPAKNTRARASARIRKTTTEDSGMEAPAEPVKKTTRSRATAGAKASTGVITTTVSTEATPGLKSAVSRPASRIGGPVKKTVTFQEPEKENLLPAAPAKAKSKTTETATGMRAKPVRKPAAGGRTTRASAKSATSEKRDKSPLSPKKDAQNLSLSKDADSDDELATLEKTPLKPLMKSPVKPPSMAKKPELQLPGKDSKDVDENVQEASESAGPSALGSPARRPPSSPFKDMMKSPAKKVEAIPLLVQSSKDDQAAQSPAKTSMLQSPAKRPQLPIKALQPPSQDSGDIARSPIKMSLFQSPAKRPTSPFKLQGPPTQSFEGVASNLFAPKTSPVEEKAPTDEVQQHAEPEPIETEDEDELASDEQHHEEEGQLESPSQLAFPGRLSAVLPRHADPALRDNPIPMKDVEMGEPDAVPTQLVGAREEPVAETASHQPMEDVMDIDVVESKEEEAAPSDADAPSQAVTTPPQSPPKPATNPAFGLRAKDLDDQYVDESEDELAGSGKTPTKYQDDSTLSLAAVPATPTPSTLKTPRGMPSSAVKAASRAIRSVSKASRLGFTPLANQLSEWKASSPTKKSTEAQVPSPEGFSLLKDNDIGPAEATPSRSFFDEEMRIRAEMENQAAIEAALEAEIEAAYGDGMPEFDDIPITNEDVELAAEANEMSLMETAHDDSVSEASQEYGDENAVPIDPAILGSNAGPRRLEPVTPMRQSAQRTFHTISKVPLKPADDSTPAIKKRCASASKLPPMNRPTGLFRNATVISYSPTKDSDKMDIDEDDEPAHPPVTPSKSDMWSSLGTPARTPRRDLNTSLLRGAVIFVDVHTSEGADASTIFVELLTQMGARCVKSWPWNPTNPTNEDGSSKVGITHVVYKDGGKRTLEKVRETGGVVQCVGVGWVLDCERENRWLDEAPYYVDTSLVPRGGHNRRKSMEPKALANFNGTLVTPMKPIAGPGRECQTVPNNHISRRDSTAWMRTPSDYDEDEDAPYEHDWDREISMLSPVPKTPAPQDVARFAMDVTPETASSVGDGESELDKEQLLMRTCPPKSAYSGLGEPLLKQEKDQGILMRLMAARRKSLQFAPKVASPLSKAWN
ncbi:hypothetical protein F5Y05DRAFT_413516 [Hypoxylon sp. FL0543]|nr:hypothetical protein F5Y05DRAFT_413516 [Hypoxylon sp. FL0543]